MHRLDAWVNGEFAAYIRVRYVSDRNIPAARARFDWSLAQVQYWQDKPKVDYIYIEPKFRGNGLAELLYIEMANRLSRMFSLPLYDRKISIRQRERPGNA